jgi:hypothetical protein
MIPLVALQRRKYIAPERSVEIRGPEFEAIDAMMLNVSSIFHCVIALS